MSRMLTMAKSRRNRPITAGLLLAIGLCGCSEQTVTVDYAGPALTPERLGLSGVECPPTGYVLLDGEPSRGRFPAALAVAQIASCDPPRATEEPAWKIVRIAPEVAAGWNSLLVTVPAAREVVVLDALATPTDAADRFAIVRAGGAATANLTFIFGTAESGYECHAYVGALFEAPDARPVALVRSQAGPADFEPRSPARPEQDLRHTDPQYLALRELQAQLRACVLELIVRDAPPETTTENPWEGAVTQPPVLIMPNQPVFLGP